MRKLRFCVEEGGLPERVPRCVRGTLTSKAVLPENIFFFSSVTAWSCFCQGILLELTGGKESRGKRAEGKKEIIKPKLLLVEYLKIRRKDIFYCLADCSEQLGNSAIHLIFVHSSVFILPQFKNFGR